MMVFFWGCHGVLQGSGTGMTNGDAELRVTYSVENEQSLMIMAESESLIVLKEIHDAWGETVLDWNDWKQSQYRVSNAVLLSSPEISCNWPIRMEDSPLEKGEWTFIIGAYNQEGYPTPNTSIDVQFAHKEDLEPTTGIVNVWIVTTSSVDAQIQENLEEAVDGWKEIWENVGLELHVRFGTGANEPLPLVYEGSIELASLRNQGEEGELLVLVGESFPDAPEVLGFAGNVPGSVLSGKRSAIAVSWLANAGVDAAFDEEEIRLFSETLAHEAGHYLGLYHPVEIEFSQWDALSDTEECTNQITCQQALKNNIMYPYPICMGDGCIAQFELTEQQQFVLHNNTAVR